MQMILRRLGVIVVLTLISTRGLPGQDTGGNSANQAGREPAVATAYTIEDAPQLDGQVIDDPVWQSVNPTSGFWQTRPVAGQQVSEKTEVRIAYTADTLYFGVVCYDREPQSIIVSDSRRDSALDETDSFQIILDTYRDRQNGFVFGTNPAAIEYDGQVTNEGEGTTIGGTRNRQQGGSGAGFNINWDGAWDVRTHVGTYGWSIEFAIPFRTLRYPQDRLQTWGLNFQRNIRRKNEIAYWAELPRQYNLYRVSRAGALEGLEIPDQRNLKFIPYVLGEVRRRGDQSGVWTGTVGLDAKYSLTPSLTLDATYNTDFAQVEVDEHQINLDRFNLFFPEKRPFFLENAGLFAVGDSGEAELFFSRNIGIGPAGQVIPIVGGARLSGKLARTNVGFLNMQTQDVEGVTPGNNYTVARVSRELPNRSSIGGIFINRQATGAAGDSDYNRTFGFDGKWGIGEYGQIAGFLASTATPGLSQDDYAYKIGGTYKSPAWQLDLNYTELGENFNPEVGFLKRTGGYRKSDFIIFHTYRPSFGGFHEIRPHVVYRGYWAHDGFHVSSWAHIDSHWEWKNGFQINTTTNLSYEGVSEPFTIFEDTGVSNPRKVVVPAGIYRSREHELVFNTNEGAWLSFRGSVTKGAFFGGNRFALSPSMQLRLGETFNTNVSLSRNDISLPGGSFITNLLITRLSYSFTPRIFAQALIQYNDAADVWATNLRFGWRKSANTGLYIIYNDTRGLFDAFRDPLNPLPDRSLVIKYTQLFDLFN